MARGTARRWAGRATVPVVVVVLLLLATVLTAEHFAPRDPFAVEAIAPAYELIPVTGAAGPAPRPAPVAARSASRSACPSPPRLPSSGATAAIASGPLLPVFATPGGRLLRTLTNPTPENQRLHVLILGRQGFWYRVQIPVRPNGATGWVSIADVTTFAAPYRILVELCAHRVTVFRAGTAVWQRPVAVGKPSTPTPTGSFYVDFVTTMRPGGAYGPWLLSIAGFSNVLQDWGGGVGQIAMHGTNRPALIGQSVSHGCVRMRNADITYLAHLVPPGTPVTIAA